MAAAVVGAGPFAAGGTGRKEPVALTPSAQAPAYR